jgi:two-component system OmpR family response regulator
MQISPYPIFLVEDNELYVKTLEKHLADNLDFSTRIYTFLNGEDCLQNMKLKPKIIILDYFLNSANENASNGLEILKRVKAIDPGVAVIMLSSQDNLKVATDTMKYGAFDYVSKNENSFLRVQNAINNINKMIIKESELRMSRVVKRVLIGWIILLIAISIIMQVFFPQFMRNV